MLRQANIEDIPNIQRLLEQILLVHHEARPDIFKSSGSKFTDKELEDLIRSEQTPIFVFTDDTDHILGHLFLQIKYTESNALQPIKTLFIDDLCVDEAARGQHIGQKLYQFALEFAKTKGCYNLTLNVWNDNAGALRFYERLGMTAQVTTMEVVLS